MGDSRRDRKVGDRKMKEVVAIDVPVGYFPVLHIPVFCLTPLAG
jgi:hypothetical protein